MIKIVYLKGTKDPEVKHSLFPRISRVIELVGSQMWIRYLKIFCSQDILNYESESKVETKVQKGRVTTYKLHNTDETSSGSY